MPKYNPQVRRHFRPEFINRVDEFIIFEPLRRDQILAIVALRVRGVVGRLKERRMKLVGGRSGMGGRGGGK
jgi:ATP-dependent Clp protease ATP-binding subunit ClpA